MGEIIPLEFITQTASQEIRLRVRFDTLCNDGQIETLGQRNNRLDNRRVHRIGREVAHEGLVNFQGRDREVLQVAKGRIFDAEVVNGDPNPDVAQFPERGNGPFPILDEETLRELHLERGGLQTGLVQDLDDHVAQIMVLKESSRDIRRYP